MFISVMFVVWGEASVSPFYFFIPENIKAINPIKTRKDKNVPPSPTALNIQLPIIPVTARPIIKINITPIQLIIPFKLFIILSQYSNIRFPIIIPIKGKPTSINIT